VWPLLAGFTLLPLFLLRLDALAPWAARPFLACVPAGVAITVWLDAHAHTPGFASERQFLVAVFLAPTVFLAAALARSQAPARRLSFAAAGTACIPLFGALAAQPRSESDLAALLLSVLLLGFWMLLASSGARSGVLVGLAAVLTAFTQWVVETGMLVVRAPIHPSDARSGVAILLGGSALFVLWPMLRRSIWKESRSIAWTAPFAAIVGLPQAMELWRKAYEGAWSAVPPAFFAGLLLAGSAWAWSSHRDEFRAERRADRTAIAVFGIHALALASLFLGLAVAIQLDRSRWTPTAAALCLGAALVWRQTDHAPLKYLAFLSAAATTMSALWFAMNERHETYPIPLLSGHGFDFLVPGAALVVASLAAYRFEVPRARPREMELYPRAMPVMSALAALGGLAVILVWITVEVENHFATGDSFLLEFGDFPARDLALSIAWAVFAMVLLLGGMRRRVGVLRWVSLVLLLATIGKVFLLDLHDLRGLYRVGSFLGLAVSLLAVSLLYQRFVFRKERLDAA